MPLQASDTLIEFFFPISEKFWKSSFIYIFSHFVMIILYGDFDLVENLKVMRYQIQWIRYTLKFYYSTFPSVVAFTEFWSHLLKAFIKKMRGKITILQWNVHIYIPSTIIQNN